MSIEIEWKKLLSRIIPPIADAVIEQTKLRAFKVPVKTVLDLLPPMPDIPSLETMTPSLPPTDLSMKDMSSVEISDTYNKPHSSSDVGYCLECVPSSTIVYTTNSVVEMGSINDRYTIIDHRGQVKNIAKSMKRYYQGHLTKIDFAYVNIPLELTPEHPLYIVKNVRKPQSTWREKGIDESLLDWIPAKDITNEDFIAFPRIKEIKDAGIATEDLMELIGLYIAEGSFDKGKRGINLTFSFGRHEEELIAHTITLIENVFGILPCVTDTETQTAVRIILSNKYFAPIFEQFGVGARNKTIPSWILYLPENKQYRLLKGMIVGDGSEKPYSITYFTSSTKLAYRLRLLLFRLGILHGLQKNKLKETEIEGRTIKSHGYGYNFIISGDSARILAQKTGIEYDGGERTSGNFGYVTENYIFIPIKNVSTRDFRGYVHNIHVNESESYLTIHGAIHNCLDKHIHTAKILAREALQRVQAKESEDRVLEKMRGVVEELAGAEDDSSRTDDPEVLKLNDSIRSLRRDIWSKKLEVQIDNPQDIYPISKQLDAILDTTFSIAKRKQKNLISFLDDVESKTKEFKKKVKKKAEHEDFSLGELESLNYEEEEI